MHPFRGDWPDNPCHCVVCDEESQAPIHQTWRKKTIPVRDYDTIIARMAGNIAAGLVGSGFTYKTHLHVAEDAVIIARLIVNVVRETEPDCADPKSEAK
jgi:hypothetical protein